MNFFNLKKLLTKILQNIRRLPNYYNLQGGTMDNRPITANIDCDGSGSVIHFLSTSSMLEGRPNKDGNILHFNWDGTLHKWASQLFIGHGQKAGIKQRYQKNANGDWSSWADVFYYPEPISDNDDLNSYTESGDYFCKTDARAQTLSNSPSTNAFWLRIRNGLCPEGEISNPIYRTQILLTRFGKQYIRTFTIDGNNITWKSWESLDDKKVNRSGDTMTGNLSVTKSGPTVTAQGSGGNTAARLVATSDVGSVDMRAQGSSTTTPAMGLYDITNGHWIIQHTVGADKTYLSQLCPSSTSTSVTWASAVSDANKTCNLIKIGRLVFISFYCSYSARQTFIPSNNETICTLPTGYRPATTVSMPAIFMRNSSSDGTLTNTTQVGGTCTITTGGIIRQSNSSICNAVYFSGVFEASA